MGVDCTNFMTLADPHHCIHIAAKNSRRTLKSISKNPRGAYRAPIAPLMAVSTETRLEAPTCGVAMGNLPPAFWRLVSAISMCDAVFSFRVLPTRQKHINYPASGCNAQGDRKRKPTEQGKGVTRSKEKKKTTGAANEYVAPSRRSNEDGRGIKKSEIGAHSLSHIDRPSTPAASGSLGPTQSSVE